MTTNLGSLSGGASHAFGINASGQIVGDSMMPTGEHAFLYSRGVMRDLGTLGGTTSFSTALAINDNGDIVGSVGVDHAPRHAMLYKSGVMMDLNTLVDPTLGFVFASANAINAVGQILVRDAGNHSYLLTPNVTIGTAPATAPHLVAALISASKVNLTWMPIAGATNYSVFRGTASGGPSTKIGTVSNETMFNDAAVQPSTLYYYTVSAENSHGSSPNSNEAIAGTTLPGPISNLKTSIINSWKIGLTWNPAVNATGYEIYKSSTAGGYHKFVDVTINTSFTDREWFNFEAIRCLIWVEIA